MPERGETRYMVLTNLQTCVLPDGTEKRGAEVTFRESAKGERGGARRITQSG
jgi:hypothetical protein